MKLPWVLKEDSVFQPDYWPAVRLRFALSAVALAIATAVLVAGPSDSPAPGFGAVLYVSIAGLALFFPAAVTAQVMYGQLLVGSVLLGADEGVPLGLVLAMVGVVATAELLAAVARLDTPLPGVAGDTVQRTGRAGLIAGAVFAAVLLVGDVPGPTGFAAVVVATGACMALAIRLAKQVDQEAP